MVRAWVGVGSLCVFAYVGFCVRPSMVLNQRQVSLVVADWESYLGSLGFTFGLWVFVSVWVFGPHGTVSVLYISRLLFCSSVQLCFWINQYGHLPRCVLVRSLLLLRRRGGNPLHRRVPWHNLSFPQRSPIHGSDATKQKLENRWCRLPTSDICSLNWRMLMGFFLLCNLDWCTGARGLSTFHRSHCSPMCFTSYCLK